PKSPGMPISAARSLVPISNASMPGTAAIASALAIAVGVSIIGMTRRAALAACVNSGVAVTLGPEEEKLSDNPIETHYTRQDLGDIILAALKQVGKDINRLTPDDLAPVDEFHGGQRQATIRLADLLGFRGDERVLDVGSGIGGPSR